MSLTSSRLAIANALVALIQTVNTPSTSIALFQKVKLGAMFNPSNLASWCSVRHAQGQGKPAGSGGNQVGWRIDDTVTFLIECGVGPYELDSTAAETSMFTIQDTLLPSLHTHFQLPDATNPTNAVQSVYSVQLENTPDKSIPKRFPNGHVYLLWYFMITVKQQYNIVLTQP